MIPGRQPISNQAKPAPGTGALDSTRHLLFAAAVVAGSLKLCGNIFLHPFHVEWGGTFWSAGVARFKPATSGDRKMTRAKGREVPRWRCDRGED